MHRPCSSTPQNINGSGVDTGTYIAKINLSRQSLVSYICTIEESYCPLRAAMDTENTFNVCGKLNHRSDIKEPATNGRWLKYFEEYQKKRSGLCTTSNTGALGLLHKNETGMVNVLNGGFMLRHIFPVSSEKV